MSRDSRTRLHDVLLASRSILEFTEGLDFTGYDTNRLVQSALERHIGIIGEAMSHVRQADETVEQRLPEVAQMVGIRNRIIQGYAYVDNEIVWDVIRNKIPRLIVRIEAFLKEDQPAVS